MTQCNRSSAPAFAALVAFFVIAIASGCEWWQGTDTSERLAPFISNLTVSRGSVRCDEAFTISFQYDDPQGDMVQATVTLQLEGETTVREEVIPWPEAISRSSGLAEFPLTFPCPSTTGRWLISVKVDDGRHTSNSLSGAITLNATS